MSTDKAGTGVGVPRRTRVTPESKLVKHSQRLRCPTPTTADPDRATLTEQIIAGALAAIPGTLAAAVVTLNQEGHLVAPPMAGDDVA